MRTEQVVKDNAPALPFFQWPFQLPAQESSLWCCASMVCTAETFALVAGGGMHNKSIVSSRERLPFRSRETLGPNAMRLAPWAKQSALTCNIRYLSTRSGPSFQISVTPRLKPSD